MNVTRLVAQTELIWEDLILNLAEQILGERRKTLIVTKHPRGD